MPAPPTQELPQHPPLRKWAGRLVGLLVASSLTWFVTRPTATVNDPAAPPVGFLSGVKDGAKMPLALPRLLLGHDTTIYAASNTGRTYKLGYTVGVNACGAVFFGFVFWRVGRLKNRIRSGS